MIEVIEIKELKSTTRVEGVLVKCTGNVYYAVTRYMPPRSPWMLRATKATRTGKMSLLPSDVVYELPQRGKPDLDEAVNLLIQHLNA